MMRRGSFVLGLVPLLALSVLLYSSLPVSASDARPSPGFDFKMAYDEGSDQMILFGGWGAAGSVGGTWTFNFNENAWTKMAPASQPTASGFGPGLAYDGESDRTILFGGNLNYPCFTSCTYNNETWAYDVDSATWTEKSPTPRGPSARTLSGMTYDAASDRVILFAGRVDATVLNDTWAYDFNANSWTERVPTSAPPARHVHSMVYAIRSDRVILFGGLQSLETSSELADTWAYDYGTNTWTVRASGPPARFVAPMAYDAESDRVILFGGETDSAPVHRNDTWAYDFTNDTWTEMDPPTSPPGGSAGAMAYDAASDRVILFGGQTVSGGARKATFGFEETDATWAYDFNANTWTLLTHPGAPKSLEASAGDGAVELSWGPPDLDYDAPIVGYRIFRGTTSGNLAFLTQVGDVQTFTDGNVTNGVTYYYHVTALNEAGEGPRSDERSATPEEPPDTTPPTILITAPKDGASVTNTTVSVTGTASDNVGIREVELSTDGTNWELASGNTSWSGSVTLVEGENTIMARATDTSGNTDVDTVRVSFPPPVTSIDPLLLAIAAAVAAGGVAGAVLFVLRRRRG